jgi:virginiamycin B lyase
MLQVVPNPGVRMRSLLLAVLVLPVADSRVPAQGPAKAPLQLTEWTVPWEKTRPRDPFLDAQGRVWFVGQEGNYVASLDPTAGTFKRYGIESGTNPHNLVVDKSGKIWFSGNRNARIGWLDPATGKTTIYHMPDPAARDPHTMTFDKNGEMWFTAQFSNFVGHLDPRTGKVRLMKPATKDARPYGIVIDPSGRPWFDEFGTNKIASIDPSTFAIREYVLPNARTRPRRIAVTSDGTLWYGDYTRGMLGRLDPKTGAVREFPLPAAAQSLPYAMASDDRDRIWLAETGVQPNRLVGFDPKTESWISITPVAQSGGLTIRHMIFHAPTRTLWFGTDANTIGRAVVP